MLHYVKKALARAPSTRFPTSDYRNAKGLRRDLPFIVPLAAAIALPFLPSFIAAV
jgi:hypothetical protein